VTRAYVALGSNLDDPSQQVRQALEALASLANTQLLQHSRFYLTPPWGIAEQPPFVNAVAELDTALTPHVLLDALLEIEQRAGRVRAERNGPRTLDLDLLYIDGVQISDARLTLPHPRMADRVFVLLPLHDVAPDLALPGNMTVAQRLQQLDLAGIERLP
jgi:2-amino-4-hydroxy-6-hydroxymethyldihydropteridine diphosphokinase